MKRGCGFVSVQQDFKAVHVDAAADHSTGLAGKSWTAGRTELTYSNTIADRKTGFHGNPVHSIATAVPKTSLLTIRAFSRQSVLKPLGRIQSNGKPWRRGHSPCVVFAQELDLVCAQLAIVCGLFSTIERRVHGGHPFDARAESATLGRTARRPRVRIKEQSSRVSSAPRAFCRGSQR
jgi:hypothetical protein